MLNQYLGPKPRNFRNSDAPGDYRLATVISKTSLNPGELVNIKQYITGYGQIDGIKLVSYISSAIFDESASYMTSGFGRNKDNPSISTWGKTKLGYSNSGLTLIPGGIKAPTWELPTFIHDMENNSNSILTERALPIAPFTYNLKLKPNAPPGLHYLSFYLTYFNGANWACLESRVEIKINNKFEQYSTPLSILAALALIVTIFHDGAIPILESIHELGKYIQMTRQSH